MTDVSVLPEKYEKTYGQNFRHHEMAEFILPERAVYEYEHAIVTKHDYIDADSAMGAIYNQAGQLVEHSRHLRRSFDLVESTPTSITVDDSLTLRELRGSFIYLGWFFNHYGHFLLESFCRAWILPGQDLDPETKFIFHIHSKSGAVSERNIEFLSLLGISRDRIVFADENLRVQKLIVPTQQAVLARKMSLEVASIYQLIAKKVIAECDHSSPEKIYISRRKLLSSDRKYINEYLAERSYSNAGYSVIHPQDLSAAAQVSLFALAEQIAGTDGSGLHAVLFCTKAPSITVMGDISRLPAMIIQVYLNSSRGCKTSLVLQDRGEEERTAELGSLAQISAEALSLFCPQSRGHAGEYPEQLLHATLTALRNGDDQCLNFLGRLEKRGEVNPGFLHFLKARALLKLRRLEEAAEAARAALDESPADAKYLTLYSRLLADLNRLSEAADAMATLVSRQPQNPALQQRLCALLLGSRRFGEAETVAREALAISPDSARVVELLAQSKYHLGDLHGAIKLLAEAVARFPDDSRIQTLLQNYKMKLASKDHQ